MPADHSDPISPAERAEQLRRLAGEWSETNANERASFQSWLIRFCEALGVAPPTPPTDDYRFELPVHVVDREGRESTNFIDCWKRQHFAIEAKAFAEGAGADRGLRKAYGQLRNYMAHVSGDAPPYLMVVDVPRTLIVWDRWSGSYGDFAAGRRLPLASLHEREEDVALLVDIFERPAARDPRGRAQRVTKEIAERLARLAAALEDRGLETERVARFLMRCVFSCFAEDVGLLPQQLFRRTLETARGAGDPEHLRRALTLLWETMDSGGMFGAELLRRFNGHFFRTVEALPLRPEEVQLLVDASAHDWSRVEPSIFGTLLVRALDPEERHRLGAEYTPREYIERLVEPTVVEPIRERWTAVQAAVLQLEEQQRQAEAKKAEQPKVYGARRAGAKEPALPKPIADAVAQLRGFHEWMRGLSFLDPACGSGNFLYVTMAAVKRIELEVLNEIDRLSHDQRGLILDEVHPRQFHGIEVKPWAREIAELTLWIGYHQFWRETHGGRTPPDPVLEDTGTIECRDAVLAWDAIVHRPEKDRLDPTPRIVHPVTGELVPDPNARLPYYEYVGARPAEWPRADFIIGNPPYLGEKRQREVLSEGYVDAMRAAYPASFENVDLVLYWWYRSALLVDRGDTIRAGLITTNSIRQQKNRFALEGEIPDSVGVAWAIADHPWIEESDGAAVRVSMTVIAKEPPSATLVSVDEHALIIGVRRTLRLNSDLTAHADVASVAALPLKANSGVAAQGFKLVGSGFLVGESEAHKLLRADRSYSDILRRYRNGRDLASRPRDVWVIDFAMREESDARRYSQLFDIVRDRVKPERDANKRAIRAKYWWRFGEPNPNLRQIVDGLDRYIATVEVSKYRYFVFLESDVAPDGSLIVVASRESYILGVLSSIIHVTWALASGGRLGVGNDPRYSRALCFSSFPFPHSASAAPAEISDLAERLDAHRKGAIARDERVTMTGMYNVVEKLRSGEPLTAKERAIHEIAACGVLRDLHDELDPKVAEAYGWPWPMEREEILERLVALHDERVEEERRGLVRWLRPDYQIPRFGGGAARAEQTAVALETQAAAVEVARPAWPATAVEQLAAIGALLAARPLGVDEVAASFDGARRDLVERHLETLALMGEVVRDADGRYQPARKAA